MLDIARCRSFRRAVPTGVIAAERDAPERRVGTRRRSSSLWGAAPLFASGTSVWTIPDAAARAWWVPERRSGPTSIAARTVPRLFLTDQGGIMRSAIRDHGVRHLINLTGS